MSIGPFYYQLKLSLEKIVKDAAETAAPGIFVEHDGRRGAAAENTEEWVRLNVLSANPERQRAGEWIGTLLLQIACFSRFAEDRADSKTDRPYELAGLISAEITQKNHPVKDYDQPAPTEKGSIYLQEPQTNYISERELDGVVGGGQPSNVHGVVLTIRAFASSL